MTLKRDDNRTVASGAVNNIVVGLRVDPTSGALIVVNDGTPTTVSTQSKVKFDDNRRPAMALLDNDTDEDVWAARCDDNGYLIMKSV